MKKNEPRGRYTRMQVVNACGVALREGRGSGAVGGELTEWRQRRIQRLSCRTEGEQATQACQKQEQTAAQTRHVLFDLGVNTTVQNWYCFVVNQIYQQQQQK